MEWINYIKEKIEQGKQDAFVWYSVAARWVLFAQLLIYASGCLAAGEMIGPIRYIEFLYHCSHFGRGTQVTTAARQSPDGIIPLAPVPQKPKRAPVYKPESSF